MVFWIDACAAIGIKQRHPIVSLQRGKQPHTLERCQSASFKWAREHCLRGGLWTIQQ